MQSLANTRVLDEFVLACVPQLPFEVALNWLERIRHWPAAASLEDAQPLSAGEVYRMESELGPVVVKRRFETGLKGLLVRPHLREPQLQRAYRLGLAAVEKGLRTPAPLFYASRHVRFGLEETVLIATLARGRNPWEFLSDVVHSCRMLEGLGRELANWHTAGFRHRDLKGPNLLYDETSDGPTFLDLAGAHEAQPCPSLRMRAHDIGRLKTGASSFGISHAQWCLLLDAYLEQSGRNGHGISRFRTFYKMIEKYVRSKLHRNIKNKRPIF